jgi:hypothetical protein
MERGNCLDHEIWNSMYGLRCSQTIGMYDGKMVVLTKKGPHMMTHLTWLESIHELQQLNQGKWM